MYIIFFVSAREDYSVLNVLNAFFFVCPKKTLMNLIAQKIFYETHHYPNLDKAWIVYVVLKFLATLSWILLSINCILALQDSKQRKLYNLQFKECPHVSVRYRKRKVSNYICQLCISLDLFLQTVFDVFNSKRAVNRFFLTNYLA